jgi:MOSC domain-containing protein YiiM
MTSKIYPLGVYCGQVTLSQDSGYEFDSAIDKKAVKGKLYLSIEGLEGDECGDKRHHGGTERALHQYPVEHYVYWQKKYTSNRQWQAPGMGENLSTIGMTEQNVCLGDRYQWGEAVIEVSQPRSPCFKLNAHWGLDTLSVDMQQISRCGWLYRVLTPGFVSVDEPLELISRPENAMSIETVCQHFFTNPLNTEGLLALSKQLSLSRSWMSKVEQRLATGQLENWNFRLLGRG